MLSLVPSRQASQQPPRRPLPHSSPSKWLVFQMTLLCLALLVPGSSAYASWLKCFVDMDMSEVVMWAKVIPPEESVHDVRIEVQPYGSSEWFSGNSYQLPPVSPDAELPVTLKVRLQVPEQLENEDVQFVMEAQYEEDDESVQFVDRGVMCDGTRAFSTRQRSHVVLRIDPAAASSAIPISLIAMWAPGMEAVVLTEKFVLQPHVAKNASTPTNSTQEECRTCGEEL